MPAVIVWTMGQAPAIVDNFAARNVGFRPASFHRYELKEVRAPKAEKKPAAPVSEPQEATQVEEEVALVQSNPG